jgi:competence protein ComEC
LTLKEELDFIVISENPKLKIENLLGRIKFKKLIFDSSNSAYKIKLWKQQCRENGIAFYDVSTQGAFVENL